MRANIVNKRAIASFSRISHWKWVVISNTPFKTVCIDSGSRHRFLFSWLCGGTQLSLRHGLYSALMEKTRRTKKKKKDASGHVSSKLCNDEIAETWIVNVTDSLRLPRHRERIESVKKGTSSLSFSRRRKELGRMCQVMRGKPEIYHWVFIGIWGCTCAWVCIRTRFERKNIKKTAGS